jgi:hypothetical protein
VSPAFLHRFWHLRDEDIGELPLTYNFLVGYYHKLPDDQIPKVLHYTSGMPFMPGYEDCDYSDLWYRHRDEMKENRDF